MAREISYLVAGLSFVFSMAAFGKAPLAYIDVFDSLLRKHVVVKQHQGQPQHWVDYNAWAKDERHKQAVSLLQKSEPSGLTREEQLSFWINAYNLLTIDLINQKNERESIMNLKFLFISPWKRFDWQIGKEKYTLDHIEHQILRHMNEPRIHFAIVCASISCPDIRPEAYRAKKLEQQLAEQTTAFLKNTVKGMQVSDSGIRVSKLFKWFKNDFTEEGTVLQYIAKELNRPLEGKVTGYLDYDWGLNLLTR